MADQVLCGSTGCAPDGSCYPFQRYSPGRHPVRRSLSCFVIELTAVLVFWVGLWEAISIAVPYFTGDTKIKNFLTYVGIAGVSFAVILWRYFEGHESAV